MFGDISGAGWGGLGEYVAVPDVALAPLPESIEFTSGAALPQAGLLALAAVGESPLDGKRVLVVGGGGGVGTYAIQLAVVAGAMVTGMDRAEKHALMRACGAEQTIDHRQTPLAAIAGAYDLVIDMVARGGPADYCRLLRRVGGPPSSAALSAPSCASRPTRCDATQVAGGSCR